MPGGNVTLKAISVNGYGKSSTIKEVGYKFNKKPWMKTMMTVDDTLGDWKLGTTTKEAFTQKCGEGTATETVYNYTIGMDMEKVTYDWGYACFCAPADGKRAGGAVHDAGRVHRAAQDANWQHGG